MNTVLVTERLIIFQRGHLPVLLVDFKEWDASSETRTFVTKMIQYHAVGVDLQEIIARFKASPVPFRLP